MDNLFNTTQDHMLTYEDYCNLFFALGFIKFPYEKDTIEEVNEIVDKKTKKVNLNLALSNINNNENKQNLALNSVSYKKKSEIDLLKRRLENSIHGGKTPSETIYSNKLLIFCTAVLCLYNGDFVYVNSSESNEVKLFVLTTEENS